MRRRLLYLAALSMVVGFVFAPAAFAQSRGPSGADGTYNCADFDDQGQAQQFFNSAGAGDPHGLDADGDGLACEDSLPTATPGNTQTTVEPVSCSGFASQFGAQQFYDFNASPQQRAMLDADGDGFACEEGDQGIATTEQYTPAAQPKTPVQPQATATTGLPSTGGPALLIPAAGLLLGAGLISIRAIRRNS